MFSISRLFSGTVATAALLSGWAAHAQTVTTDPVGYISVSVPADSDTYVNVPLKPSTAFAGVAGSLVANGQYDPGESFTDGNGNGSWDSGEAYQDSQNTITFANPPNFTASQFVYAAPNQRKHFFVFLASGAKAGAFYSILSNTTTSITVDLAGDSLAAGLTFGSGGTKLQITPYDTLGTIFPAGAGIVASTSNDPAARQTEILIPDQQSVGKNLPPARSYYYFADPAGSTSGWRLSGNSSTVVDDDVLYPDNFFIIRTKAGQASTLTMMGGVQMSSLQAPLSTFAPNTTQDNPVALPVATPLTLAQTKLFESGAFAGSANHSFAGRQDELLVWDNTVIGHSKPSKRSYYYFTGTNPGWRLNGDINTVRNSEVVISPSTAIVVRKKGTFAARTAFWSVKPPYVP